MQYLCQNVKVAPLAGAWIETWLVSYASRNFLESHPSRVRGLKHGILWGRIYIRKSHPSRVRGLKLGFTLITFTAVNVAPLAGAWIETGFEARQALPSPVAPLAGAWIETASINICLNSSYGRTPRGCVD